MTGLGSPFPRHTRIWVFNVGRGLAVFIQTALNQGILYDLGASDDFSPTDFVKKNLVAKLDKYEKCRIAQVVLSHPHSDHISEIDAIAVDPSTLYPKLLTCPHDKERDGFPNEKVNWNRIQNPSGSEKKIEAYKSLYKKRTLPLQTIQYKSTRPAPDSEYGLYYIRPPEVEKIYPTDDGEYGNATSIMLYLRHGDHSILLPADMPPESMEHVLKRGRGTEKRFTVFDPGQALTHPTWHEATGDQPDLATLLKQHGLTVLVAPHHGLESGWSDALYSSIKGGKPGLVVISEKRHLSDTDGSVDQRYQSKDGSMGAEVEIDGKKERRYSVTTRSGHHVLVVFPGSGQSRIYAESDPNRLLAKW